MLLNHVKVVLELKFLFEYKLESISELVQVALRLALVPQRSLCAALLLDHLQLELCLSFEQRGHFCFCALKRVDAFVQLIDLSRLVAKLGVLELQVFSRGPRVIEILFQRLILYLQKLDELCLI